MSDKGVQPQPCFGSNKMHCGKAKGQNALWRPAWVGLHHSLSAVKSHELREVNKLRFLLFHLKSQKLMLSCSTYCTYGNPLTQETNVNTACGPVLDQAP